LVAVGFAWQWLGGPAGSGPPARLLDELDATDPKWRLEEIEANRDQVPEADNSARVIARAARLLGGRPSHRFDEQLGNLDEGATSRLDDPRAALLRREMADLAPALIQARRLAGMPRGRHPLTFTHSTLDVRLEEQQRTRQVARLLHFDALDRGQQGDMAGAL